MDATLEQFINYIDNSARDKLENDDGVPEEADVADTYSQFYTAFAGIFPVSKQCDKDDIVRRLVEKYCSELTIKKKLGFEFKDEDSHPWLSEAEDSIEWFYWNRYRRYLVRDKKWAPAAVKSIDRDSRNILDLMANPLECGSFTRRGLVVASVQSGKTANYIGLISRAADAGYRIIIVMAGVHNVLRNQTQARLEDGFTGFNIENSTVEPVGVGKGSQARRPIACTSREADFSTERAKALRCIQPTQTNEPFLFVVKKNSKSLQQVIEWLDASNSQDQPLLLIDDEADNASINGKYKLEKRENEPTKINGQIRNLLNLFNKACYVGYTATPFANVLIDPSVDSDEYGKDLFPSNFIYTLEESSDYFGAKKVFGDYDEPTHKHLRFIDDADDGGVRTESWTAGRSGLEVRMYSREKVELFLLATEDGMGPTAAAEFAGVTVSAAKKWATGHLPRSYTGGGCRIVARKPPRKEASLGPDKSIYAPPATGPLAGLNEDQIENLLLRAVLADLKAEGWDPASISNRSKCELGERLRRATALPLRSITGFLRISKSSYEYWRPRVAAPRDRDADIRDRVVRIFREGSGCWGYRTVWARLRREGVRASEKRVARVMREEGLEVVYNRRRARGYSSCAGEVSKAPENLVNRNFHADEPNRLWLTDITEFRLPGGEKVYLSPVIDCFDGMPVAWSIGLHPDKRLANSSLLKACAARPAGARTTIHSDRGGHYRWPEWIGICEENGLVRSMSAKGCSPDNSACEGFFGRLKNEFFRYRDWEGVTAEEFMGRLEAYLVYYRDGRIKKSLEWLSPMEYRRKLVEWEG